MRKRISLWLLGALLAAFCFPPVGGASAASDLWWMTRGRTPDHGNAVIDPDSGAAAAEPFAPLELAWTLDGMGMTATQPIFVDGAVYHLAQGGLFRVTFDGDGTARKENIFGEFINKASDGVVRPPVAGMTYVERDGKRVLYFATGSNQICAYDLDTPTTDWTMAAHCLEVTGQIVSTPLVFGEDMVVVGDKAGKLWAVRGLLTPGLAKFNFHLLLVDGAATWITSSAVRVPGTATDFIFSAYVPGGGKALLGRARIVVQPSGLPALQVLDTEGEAGELWTASITEAGRGMADGFTLDPDKGVVYMSDLKGRMYKKSVDQRDEKSDIDPPEPRFANDMPAMSVDRKTVYFSMRTVNPDDPNNPSSDLPGSIIAVDNDTWTIKHEYLLADDMGAANTPPLVWDDALVVGTAKGYTVAYDIAGGALKQITTGLGAGYQDEGEKRLLPLKTNELPNKAEFGFSALNGAGVQPMVSTGGGETLYFVMGVNYCNPGGTECSGRLMGFKPGQDEDPMVEYLYCPEKPLEWFDASADLGFMSSGSAPFQGSLEWDWAFSDGQSGTLYDSVSLEPNDVGQNLLRINATDPAPVTVTLTARLILPDGYQDANPNNNAKSCTVEVQDCTYCDYVPSTDFGTGLMDPDR